MLIIVTTWSNNFCAAGFPTHDPMHARQMFYHGAIFGVNVIVWCRSEKQICLLIFYFYMYLHIKVFGNWIESYEISQGACNDERTFPNISIDADNYAVMSSQSSDASTYLYLAYFELNFKVLGKIQNYIELWHWLFRAVIDDLARTSYM